MKTRVVLFLFILLAFEGKTQTTLTNGEVFNYEVGDTFVLSRLIIHEAHPSTLLDYTTYVVIQKTNGANTFEYKIQRNTQTDLNATNGLLDTISPIYGTGGPVYCSLQPNIGPTYPLDTLWDEGLNSIDTDFCTVPIRTTNWIRHYGYYATANEIYGEGIGLIYRRVPIASQDQFGNWHYDVAFESLIYCHKVNGTVCGSRVYLGLNQALAPPKVTIYPNPTVGIFNLQVEEDNEQGLFSLFNTMGDKVIEEPIGQNLSQINCFGLSSGLYFWRLEIQGKPWANGKLVLQ